MSVPSKSFTVAKLKDVTLLDDPKIQQTRIAWLAQMLGLSRDTLEDDERDQLFEAVASVRGVVPKDEIERIAAYHIVSLSKTMGQSASRTSHGPIFTCGSQSGQFFEIKSQRNATV